MFRQCSKQTKLQTKVPGGPPAASAQTTLQAKVPDGPPAAPEGSASSSSAPAPVDTAAAAAALYGGKTYEVPDEDSESQAE